MYPSLDIGMMEWACGTHGRMGNAYRILAGSIPVWKPSRRWENDIKMNLKETRRENVDWILLAQVRTHCRACLDCLEDSELLKELIARYTGTRR
jgi:hypothetical protein